MDYAFVARVSPKASLIEVLEGIRPGTSSVVVADNDPYLVTADDIMEACNEIADKGGQPEAAPISFIRRKGVRVHPPRKPPSSFVGGGWGGIVDHFRAIFQPFAPNDERYVILPRTFEWARDIYTNAFPTFPNRLTRDEITRFAAETAAVITASETYFQVGQGVTICTCVGNPVHRYNQKELRIPGKCNKPHGVIVKCRTV
jgi:hypothetical protein